MNPERAIAYRKQASALLDAVLAEDITPRAALNCWPAMGNEDPSVRCAYTMLWFFEADEERHHLEMFYADLQIKTLQEASHCLRQGEPLSSALLRDYQQVMAPPEYSDAWVWQQPLWSLRRQIHRVLAILESHPLLRKPKRIKPKGPRC